MSEHDFDRPHDPGEPGKPDPSTGRRVGGVVLMILGVVVMLPTGLCTLILVREDPITVLIIGGVPFAIGLAIFLGGKRLMNG